MINIPYTKLDLMLAAITASAKVEEHGDAMSAKFEELEKEIRGENKAELNKLVAEHNGITVIDLINSTQMEKLINEYKESKFQLSIDIFKSFGFTDKEAWACVLSDRLESM